MRFLLDAQLPVRLADQLAAAGHDVLHTSHLPRGNRSTDADICDRADADGRVVVTKDRDFRDSHLLRATPARLLLVSTGNISNRSLMQLLDSHLATVIAALHDASFVELGPDRIVVHNGPILGG